MPAIPNAELGNRCDVISTGAAADAVGDLGDGDLIVRRDAVSTRGAPRRASPRWSALPGSCGIRRGPSAALRRRGCRRPRHARPWRRARVSSATAGRRPVPAAGRGRPDRRCRGGARRAGGAELTKRLSAGTLHVPHRLDRGVGIDAGDGLRRAGLDRHHRHLMGDDVVESPPRSGTAPRRRPGAREPAVRLPAAPLAPAAGRGSRPDCGSGGRRTRAGP